MPYMGIQELKDANVKSGSATGDGSTTTFAIGWTPPSAGSLFVTINGVLQSASAYSISASNCVFTAAPVSADAIEFKGIQSSGTVVTLGDGVVNAAQLGSSSVVTASIVDNNVTTAKILDNNVTLAKMAGLARGKIIVGDASGDPSALTVGAANQVLKSDGTDAAWGADVGGSMVYLASSRSTVNTATVNFQEFKSTDYLFYQITGFMQPVTVSQLDIRLMDGASAITASDYLYRSAGSAWDGYDTASSTSNDNWTVVTPVCNSAISPVNEVGMKT